MKNYKCYFAFLALAFIITSCSSAKKRMEISPQEQEIFAMATDAKDEVVIAEEKSNYKLIIMDLGFNRWLRSIAHPRGHYTQKFLESRNRILVIEWNNRVIMPTVYDPLLYELQITYDPNADYGYEVNYQLYNYFIYFQRKYKQRLGPFLPRI